MTVKELFAQAGGTPWHVEVRVRPLAATSRGTKVVSAYWESRQDGEDILVLGCDVESLIGATAPQQG